MDDKTVDKWDKNLAECLVVMMGQHWADKKGVNSVACWAWNLVVQKDVHLVVLKVLQKVWTKGLHLVEMLVCL